MREHLPSVAFGAVLPVLAYFVVRQHVDTDTAALIVAGCVSVGFNLVQFVRQRSIDMIGAVVLVGFALGLVTSTLLGGNAYVLKAREAFLTALLGIACLVTLFTNDRPAVFYLSRYLTAGRDPAKVSAYDRLLELPTGRHTFRVLSVVWGIGLVLLASLHLTLAGVLSTGTFVELSPFVTGSLVGVLFVFTALYTRRVQAEATRLPGALPQVGTEQTGTECDPGGDGTGFPHSRTRH